MQLFRRVRGSNTDPSRRLDEKLIGRGGGEVGVCVVRPDKRSGVIGFGSVARSKAVVSGGGVLMTSRNGGLRT